MYQDSDLIPVRAPIAEAGGGISKAWLARIASLVPREIDGSDASGDVTIDWESARQVRRRLTGNVTLTFTNGLNGRVYRLILVEDASGGHTVTWPADVVFEGGAPVLTTTANNVILAEFVKSGIGNGGYIGRVTTGAIALP